MRELQISTGLVSYKINGSVEIAFNPTDANFAKQLYDVFEQLDRKQEDYKRRVEQASGAEIFAISNELDSEMRGLVDNVLGAPVCAAVFGDVNVYALSDGLPLWANLLLTIIDEMSIGAEEQSKLTSARIAKYTKKYKK